MGNGGLGSAEWCLAKSFRISVSAKHGFFYFFLFLFFFFFSRDELSHHPYPVHLRQGSKTYVPFPQPNRQTNRQSHNQTNYQNPPNHHLILYHPPRLLTHSPSAISSSFPPCPLPLLCSVFPLTGCAGLPLDVHPSRSLSLIGTTHSTVPLLLSGIDLILPTSPPTALIPGTRFGTYCGTLVDLYIARDQKGLKRKYLRS